MSASLIKTAPDPSYLQEKQLSCCTTLEHWQTSGTKGSGTKGSRTKGSGTKGSGSKGSGTKGSRTKGVMKGPIVCKVCKHTNKWKRISKSSRLDHFFSFVVS